MVSDQCPNRCVQGCFQTHPYDTDFGGETDINRHHIIEIESACAAKSSVKVAVISDSHCWYSDLRDAVSDINAKGDVDFVVHCGDLSDTGTTKEFVWAREELDELKPPYVALIGNHDFLGTGVAPTKNKCLPIVALPTTAGTAAETTINYVIIDEKRRALFRFS